MTLVLEDLPDDVAALKALLLAERAQSDRLRHLLAQLRRAHFGRKSEKIDADQLNFGLEDIETAVAAEEAKLEKADAALRAANTRKRRANRGHLPAHLPREEIVIEPGSKACPCWGEELHQIVKTARSASTKFPRNCVCSLRGGQSTPAALARRRERTTLRASFRRRRPHVSSKAASRRKPSSPTCYADHLPLYRQAQIFVREGLAIDRSTLCHWVGFAAAELKPLHARLIALLTASTKLFCDETRCPVLDPGRGKTKTGYLWAIARDDRPSCGADPPAVAYSYAPGRGAKHACALFAGFNGVLQVDGYAGYHDLADASRPGGAIALAHCWSHFRRQFYDLAKGGNAPIATAVLDKIGALYAIEDEIRGVTAGVRRTARQDRTKPLVDALKTWLGEQLAKLPRG